MSRSPTSAVNNALALQHLEEILFVELQFKSGSSYVCTREHDVVWNGQTWLGKGRVGSVEMIQEGGELEPHGIAMTLSALPAGLLATALDPAEYKNRSCKLWYGLRDWSGYVEPGYVNAGYLRQRGTLALIADPVGPFLFRMDSLEFELGETASLRLTAESRLADWQRPRVRRYNNADQQAEYSGDEFFEFAEEMVDKVLIWSASGVCAFGPSIVKALYEAGSFLV